LRRFKIYVVLFMFCLRIGAPSYLKSFSRILPLTYFSEGLRYAVIYKYCEGIFTNMIVVSTLAAAFIIVGAIVTRWKEK